MLSFFRRTPPETRYPWGPDQACRKCGQPFVNGQANPAKVSYARDPEHGERLRCECPRCGFKWAIPPLNPECAPTARP